MSLFRKRLDIIEEEAEKNGNDVADRINARFEELKRINPQIDYESFRLGVVTALDEWGKMRRATR